MIEVEDVRNTIDVSYLTDDQIEAIIDSVGVLVQQYSLNTIYDADVIAEITRYWVAHILACRDNSQGKQKEKIGDVEVQYAQKGQCAEFRTTIYGQMVMTLDKEKVLNKRIRTEAL